jgi:hypothetical protein
MQTGVWTLPFNKVYQNDPKADKQLKAWFFYLLTIYSEFWYVIHTHNKAIPVGKFERNSTRRNA